MKEVFDGNHRPPVALGHLCGHRSGVVVRRFCGAQKAGCARHWCQGSAQLVADLDCAELPVQRFVLVGHQRHDRLGGAG